MRIFSKKTFAIGPGKTRNSAGIDLFYTVPGAFQELPDRYSGDATLQAALAAGEIILVTSQNQGLLENGAAATEMDDTAKASPEEEYAATLKGCQKTSL